MFASFHTALRHSCFACRCHTKRWHTSTPLDRKNLTFVQQRLKDAMRAGLLEDPSVRVVWLSDKSACHVVYGSCHVLKDDVMKVKELLKHLNPDKICVELCVDRSVGTEVHEDDHKFDARVKRMQTQMHTEGLEMVAALRVARRHGVPGIPIDRDENITEARLQAGCPGKSAAVVWCPRIACSWVFLRVGWQALKYHLTQRNALAPVVPVRAIQDIPIPWTWRRDLIKLAEWHEDHQVVSFALITQMLKQWKNIRERSLSKSPSEIREELLRKPASEPLSREDASIYGPESVHDIIERIFVHERDIHMAHFLRTQKQTPLTLTIVGVEHLNGIVKYLEQERGTEAQRISNTPHVQWWKKLLYPKGKLSKTYQLLHQGPQVHFRAVSRFTLQYLLRTLVELSVQHFLGKCWRWGRTVALSRRGIVFVFGVVGVGMYWVRSGDAQQSGSERGRSGSTSDTVSIFSCIRNTFIHAWRENDPIHQLHRCFSAPARLRHAEVITQAGQSKNKLSKGSEGHDEGQCKGACRHERIAVGHCLRGQDCPDCHVPGCDKKRHKFGNKGKQQRARESGRQMTEE